MIGDRRSVEAEACRPPARRRSAGLFSAAVARAVTRRVLEHEILDRAAGLSYYFLLAFFPALLFVAALLGLLPVPHLKDQLMSYLVRVLPGDAGSLVRRTLGEVLAGASGGVVSVGVVGALWAASSGMASIMSALNVAFDIEDLRPWWKRRLIAVALTVGFSVFTLIALLLLVFGERIGDVVADWMGVGATFTLLWNVVRWPVLVACVLAGVDLVYDLAPAGRQSRPWVSAGAVVAVLAWLVMSFGLRVYVTYFGNYNATYGSIGGVVLLTLWLYLSGTVLLLGAEINAVVDATDADAPGDGAAAGPRRPAAGTD